MIQLAEPSPPPKHTSRIPSRPHARDEAREDAALVRRFLKGDPSAFDAIVTRHRRRLVSCARSILHDTDDAEEIAQDAFVCAHRCLRDFRGSCSLSTWLHQITRNLALNRYWYFRRRRRHLTCSLNHTPADQTGPALVDSLASDLAGPVREIVTSEFLEVVGKCMLRLEPGQRSVLNLSRKMRYEEIAIFLGVKCGTVKSRIARARANLRAQLCEACPEFGPSAKTLAWFEPSRETSLPVGTAHP